MARRNLGELSNNEVLDLVVRASDDTTAALELKRRWKGFWGVVKRRHGLDISRLEREQMKVNDLRREQNNLVQNIAQEGYNLDQARRRVEREERRLKRVTSSRFHKMERELEENKWALKQHNARIRLLQETVKRRDETIKAMRGEIRENGDKEHAIYRVQQNMILRNLRKIDRDLHLFPLYEAEILVPATAGGEEYGH